MEEENQLIFNWKFVDNEKELKIQESLSSFTEGQNDVPEEDAYYVHDLLRDYKYLSILSTAYKEEDFQHKCQLLNRWDKYVRFFFEQVFSAFAEYDMAKDSDKTAFIRLCKHLSIVLLEEKTGDKIGLVDFLKLYGIKGAISKQVNDIRIKVEETFSILFPNSRKIGRLVEQLEKLYPHLNKFYIQGGRCLSRTIVEYDNKPKETIFSLSGIKPPNESVEKEMEEIARFTNNSKYIGFDQP